MAQEQVEESPTIGFKSVQLLKTQTLGIGSYGSVCKALCDDLLCAAKIIHPTLFDPNAHRQIERQREHRLPISRFMQECEFMSAINHPNIVQYLGTCQDPQTDLPVLLMELMDDSLTHFLESSHEEVPYHIQVNFCHDITLAISYLHSNGITHRDLSSNNVLLYGNVKAKVTDFGMAKLGDINHQATRISFTQCPGTDAYMPPEAVKDPPVYTEKIDCFSIGALIIQILTRCFPEPGDRLNTVHTTDPQFPNGIAEVRVSEIERRQNHISQIDPNHPLLPIALHCLKDSDVERPSAQELCRRVAALKETPQFAESVKGSRGQETGDTTEREQVQDETEIIQQKNMIIEAFQQECQQLKETIRDKDKLIEERETQLQDATKQLKEVTAQFQSRIQELEQQTLRVQKPQPKITNGQKLSWTEIKNTQYHRLRRILSAAVDGEIVYLLGDGTCIIYAYNVTNKEWKQLAASNTEYCSLAVVDSLLTTIGGRDHYSGDVTNQLFSLTGERWIEIFQPMPTKRSSVTTVCSKQALIVAGGLDQNILCLSKVEVMDIATKEWTSAEDLPQPNFALSTSISHERIYVLGGWSYSGGPSRSVYTCTLLDLFHSLESKPIGKRLVQSLSFISPPRSTKIWDQTANVPVDQSTYVSLNNELLAIGGVKYLGKPIPDAQVYIYRPISNTWEVFSKMNNSHYGCFAAVLPTNEVLVMGGFTEEYWNHERQTNCTIELGTVVS